MPLRKSPVRTPALLAANRANSLKSCGPRTPRGKARVPLNALKPAGTLAGCPRNWFGLGICGSWRSTRGFTPLSFGHSSLTAGSGRGWRPPWRPRPGVCRASCGKQSRNLLLIQGERLCVRYGPGLWRRTTSAGSEWSSGSSGGALRPGRCAETGPIGPVGRRAQTIGPETGRMGLTGFGAGTAAGGLAGCPTR